jgi:hypothetical protein
LLCPHEIGFSRGQWSALLVRLGGNSAGQGERGHGNLRTGPCRPIEPRPGTAPAAPGAPWPAGQRPHACRPVLLRQAVRGRAGGAGRGDGPVRLRRRQGRSVPRTGRGARSPLLNGPGDLTRVLLRVASGLECSPHTFADNVAGVSGGKRSPNQRRPLETRPRSLRATVRAEGPHERKSRAPGQPFSITHRQTRATGQCHLSPLSPSRYRSVIRSMGQTHATLRGRRLAAAPAPAWFGRQ